MNKSGALTVSLNSSTPISRPMTVNATADDLISYTPIPTILLDPSLLVSQVSDSYLLVSGLQSRDKVVGQHAQNVFDSAVTFSAHAVALKALRESLLTKKIQDTKHSTSSGEVWNVRAIPIMRNGQLRCVQMEFRDITEEHRQHLELHERLYANETYRILVETVKDYAIFMLDPYGYVATWNAGAEAFKGYKPHEIIGKHFSNFYGDEDLKADKPARELRDALRDGRCEDEGWRYRSNGSRFWANVVITPVYKDDSLLGFSKVTRDLTERRKAEQSLISAFEEASKLKSEFLANMSHEIRTPMHGMLTALTLLLDTKLDANQLDLANVIRESGNVLLQVINDILDYSKLASGSFSINNDIIDVAEIIHSVFRAQNRCRKPQVQLESFLDPDLPKAAEGDSLRYRQVLQNYLSNAHKFTEDGYVRILAKNYKEDDDHFTIMTEVIDTGIGVPAASSKALFTPFTQFDNSATKRYKGTGLGLSICKSLAELMGGNVGFFPNPEGCGSVFWFTAKLRKCSQLTVADKLTGELEALNMSSPVTVMSTDKLKDIASKKRLLLAEDNHINQKVMLRLLSGFGFNDVDTALNGQQAIDKVAQVTQQYDLILMDINMPVCDGVTATKKLRERGVTIPIVAMTANALKGHAESYVAKGMTAYLAKPVDRDLMVTVLLKCLEKHGAG